MVANIPDENTKNLRYTEDKTAKLLKAQIENSLELGWDKDKIVVVSNKDLEFMGVRTYQAPLNDFCMTGSKMFALKWYLDNFPVDKTEVIWAHDLDAWQNVWFDCPEIKDVGAACYSQPKYNGGSIFWRPQAKDIIDEIIQRINEHGEKKEEPTLNTVLFSDPYKHRVTTIDNTFNVGCSGFVIRYEASTKPIAVCHFHPYNRIAWETQALDRNGLGEPNISERLRSLIKQYYPEVADELSKDGKKAQKERIKKRQQERSEKARQIMDATKLKANNLTEFFKYFNEEQLHDEYLLTCFIYYKFGLKLNVNRLQIEDQDKQLCWGGLSCKQIPNELAQFMSFIVNHKDEINNYVEVGCEKGGTFTVIDSFLSILNKDYEGGIAIDLKEDKISKESKEYFDKYKKSRFVETKGTSFVPKENIDLCFIDADHSYNSVIDDYNHFKHFSKYIAFHDIVFEDGVRKAWEEIKENHSKVWEINNKDDRFKSDIFDSCGIGIIKI